MFFLLVLVLLAIHCHASPLKELQERLFQNAKPRNIEELIAALPPDFKANPVFVYRGFGLQQSSYPFPRTILFEPYGNLVLTFSGDPKGRGFNVIEAMEFSEQKAGFSFYELTFDHQERLVVSQENPAIGVTLFCSLIFASSVRIAIAVLDKRPIVESPVLVGHPHRFGIAREDIADELFASRFE